MDFSPSRLLALLLGLAPMLPSSVPAGEQSGFSLPPFRHPGAGQVFYFVLTDRFANGNPANDRAGLDGDREVHGFDPTGKGWYHGGDLAGLRGKLDYLQELGVTSLWITPPFRNNYVQKGSAGYHGYWINDFLRVDPHLGTNDDLRGLIDAAHARGMRLFLDIVINHTGDIIAYSDNHYDYRPASRAPYRTAAGRVFDPATVAFNGVRPSAFPALDAARSFAGTPVIPPGLEKAKSPAWLNNPAYYHNRGNSTFEGPNSLDGDFVGLDDVFTEHPDVVRGMTDLYAYWLREYKIDGYRIDTVRHVNKEFWQAFCPALRQTALSLGRPDFFHFGEAMVPDARFLADFTVETTMDSTLDFAFWKAARRFFSQGESSAVIDQLWLDDDRLTRPLGDAQLQTTFIGNHDDGRFLYFLRTDQPGAKEQDLLALSQLSHAFLLLSRGQPVLYYGDEQGMAGMGNDQMAREDMFPSRAVEYKDLGLIGSKRRGTDDKFDPTHPLFRTVASLNRLRLATPALSEGATRSLATGNPAVAAFVRTHRSDCVEHWVLFNRSAQPQPISLPHGFTAGTELRPLAGGLTATLTTEPGQPVNLTLPPYSFALFRASQATASHAVGRLQITTPAKRGKLTFKSWEKDGLIFPERAEIRAELTGGDALGEVTFTAVRSSRPQQTELLGVDAAPPYRLFWRPGPDWRDDETIAFTATFRDLRGHETAVTSEPLKAVGDLKDCGVRGSLTPTIVSFAADGTQAPRTLSVVAHGTGPLFYTWYRNDELLADAEPLIEVTKRPGIYRVVVHNQAGAVLAGPIEIK